MEGVGHPSAWQMIRLSSPSSISTSFINGSILGAAWHVRVWQKKTKLDLKDKFKG